MIQFENILIHWVSKSNQ